MFLQIIFYVICNSTVVIVFRLTRYEVRFIDIYNKLYTRLESE